MGRLPGAGASATRGKSLWGGRGAGGRFDRTKEGLFSVRTLVPEGFRVFGGWEI